MTYNTKLSTNLIRVIPVFKNEWQFEFPRLDDRSNDMLDAAIEESEVGNLKKAETDFELLIEGFPEFLDAYHYLAMIFNQTGKENQAYELWWVASEIGKNALPLSFKRNRHKLPWSILENRQFLRPYHTWGLKLMQRDETTEALDVFREILSMNPNDNQGVRALAVDCYFQLAMPDKVLSICKRFPNDTMQEVLYGQSLALFQLGKKDDARAALLRAIEWSPHTASEFFKKVHSPPINWSPKYVSSGDVDRSFLFWKYQGQH